MTNSEFQVPAPGPQTDSERGRLMWKLSIEDDQGEKTSVNLVRDEYAIGRAEANTIRLTERNISREHARLFHQENCWYLGDKDSYNGAYVNGARVVEPVRVAHGDLIQLGDYRLEVVDEALATTRTHPTMRNGLVTTTGRRDTLVNQPDRFVMVVGPSPGSEYPLTGGRMVVGRGEECDISINHASVSRVHAEVHALGDGRYELIDKGSANGLRVNAVELQRALIDARDNIELGDVILKYVPAGDIYVPGADESQILASGQVGAEAFSLSAEPKAKAASLPLTVKAGASILAASMLVVLGMLLLDNTKTPPAETTAVAEASPPNKQLEQREQREQREREQKEILEAAKRLLNDGDVFGAHAKLLELPEESPERHSRVFREIEGRWADALMEAAQAETDLEAKRGLLDQVAKSASVDQKRRKLAAAQLQELSAGSLGIDELPETSGGNAAPTPQKPKPNHGAAKPPAQRAPARSTQKAPAPTPTGESAPTLVRDDPFGQAPSGR